MFANTNHFLIKIAAEVGTQSASICVIFRGAILHLSTVIFVLGGAHCADSYLCSHLWELTFPDVLGLFFWLCWHFHGFCLRQRSGVAHNEGGLQQLKRKKAIMWTRKLSFSRVQDLYAASGTESPKVWSEKPPEGAFLFRIFPIESARTLCLHPPFYGTHRA